jgi:hypothetical protein
MKALWGWVHEHGGREPSQVYPINDTRRHVTTGTDCWCDPRVETVNDVEIVTHNSHDEREKFETGERLPS